MYKRLLYPDTPNMITWYICCNSCSPPPPPPSPSPTTTSSSGKIHVKASVTRPVIGLLGSAKRDDTAEEEEEEEEEDGGQEEGSGADVDKERQCQALVLKVSHSTQINMCIVILCVHWSRRKLRNWHWTDYIHYNYVLACMDTHACTCTHTQTQVDADLNMSYGEMRVSADIKDLHIAQATCEYSTQSLKIGNTKVRKGHSHNYGQFCCLFLLIN